MPVFGASSGGRYVVISYIVYNSIEKKVRETRESPAVDRVRRRERGPKSEGRSDEILSLLLSLAHFFSSTRSLRYQSRDNEVVSSWRWTLLAHSLHGRDSFRLKNTTRRRSKRVLSLLCYWFGFVEISLGSLIRSRNKIPKPTLEASLLPIGIGRGDVTSTVGHTVYLIHVHWAYILCHYGQKATLAC